MWWCAALAAGPACYLWWRRHGATPLVLRLEIARSSVVVTGSFGASDEYPVRGRTAGHPGCVIPAAITMI
jgi:hypothetical protein